jgi:NAD(P)-dependent dehydrogenase (short-subunit alcohol dehydrogenase family)
MPTSVTPPIPEGRSPKEVPLHAQRLLSATKSLGLEAVSGLSHAVSTVVITGAGSGIGRAIAIELATHDHEVVIVEIDEAAGEGTAAAIGEAGGTARVVSCDISNTESTEAAFSQIENIDILVNNAGIAAVGNVETCTPEELDRIYSVNVKGMYHCLHFAIPIMVKGGGGSVINMASVASYLGLQDRFAYSMSKGAVLSMTMSIARDYIDKGIRCNCVCPARVHTPFVDGYLEKNYSEEERPQMFKTLSEWQPIGRMGTPEEIAGMVAYLSSKQASFITGSAFEIDGGVTNLR